MFFKTLLNSSDRDGHNGIDLLLKVDCAYLFKKYDCCLVRQNPSIPSTVGQILVVALTSSLMFVRPLLISIVSLLAFCSPFAGYHSHVLLFQNNIFECQPNSLLFFLFTNKFLIFHFLHQHPAKNFLPRFVSVKNILGCTSQILHEYGSTFLSGNIHAPTLAPLVIMNLKLAKFIISSLPQT